MPRYFGARTVQLAELILTDSGYRPGGSSTRICRAEEKNGRSPWLYKEYSQKMLGELDETSLDELICWRQDLCFRDRNFVDSFCSFPQAIVLDGDRTVGILMDEAPAAFLQYIPGKQGLQPRHAEALGRRYREDRQKDAPYFPPPHKIALLGVLLQQIIWLHDHSIVISDLHPRNMLVTADMDMRCIYLLDCDAFWLGNLHAFPSHAPEMWRVGKGKSSTPATDLAKFALLTARAAAEDFSNPHFSDEQLRRLLPSQHVRQLRRMCSVDPSLRTETLRTMAHAWAGMVKSSPGRPTTMYIWNDDTGRIRWDPARTPVRTPALDATTPIPVISAPILEIWAHPNYTAPASGGPHNGRSTPRRRSGQLRTVAVSLAVFCVVFILAWVFWLWS